MTKYILDLDGCKHITRNKTQIARRKKDSEFIFRAADKGRWTHIMGNDILLQVGFCKTTVIVQARLRVKRRLEAFISYGYLDQVEDLYFMHTQNV